VEASFRGVDYIATLSILGGHTLRVEVERKADAHCWSGDFPAQRSCPARLAAACSHRPQRLMSRVVKIIKFRLCCHHQLACGTAHASAL